MATCFGDSSGQVYTSIPMSKSSSSSSSTSKTTIPTSPAEALPMSKSSSSSSSTSKTTIPTSPIEALPMSKSSSSTSNTAILTSRAETSPMEGLEGLKDIDPRIFVGIKNMREIVRSESDKLQKGDSDQQYLVFTHVSVDDLAEIDRARNSIGKGTRMTHYTDTNLLIVKLPTAEHESAHENLAKEVALALGVMDRNLARYEFHAVGATTYHVRGSSKEADSSYRPRSFRPNNADWPTIVFESGLSETLRKLRMDADWWLRKSNGAVKIVIIISIKRGPQTLQIEKWELAPVAGRRPNTRAFSTLNIPPPRPQIPTQIQAITIAQNTVTGAPLVLEFDKIFLRPAVLPETDITFTAQELLAWAAGIW